jgi:lipopolysaccharide transport system permease protein
MSAWRRRLSLGRELVAHDLRSRVAGSGLGPLWHALRPLGLLAIYTFVFYGVLKVEPTGAYAGLPYWHWFVAGMAPWLYLQESLARAPGLLAEYRVLARQGQLGPLMVNLVGLGSALLSHAIWLGLLVGLGLWDGRLQGLGLALALLHLGLLALALNLLVSALGAFLRDLDLGIGLLLSAAYFATPVVYPAERLPPGFSWLAEANPIAWVVEAYRSALLDGPWPSPGLLLARLALLGALAAAALALTRRLAPALKDLR